MRISQKTWLNYITKLDQIDSKAAELMTRWVIDNGLDDRNALIEYSHARAAAASPYFVHTA